METELEKKARQQKAVTVAQPFNWVKALWIALAVIGTFILLLFSLPWLIWQYLNAKAKASAIDPTKAYNIYRASMYYLNQLGMQRHLQSPQQYASEVDTKLGTHFNAFNNVYQQLKYSTTPLSNNQQQLVTGFYQPFKQQVRSSVPFKTRFSRFLNIYNTLHYFTKPKIS